MTFEKQLNPPNYTDYPDIDKDNDGLYNPSVNIYGFGFHPSNFGYIVDPDPLNPDMMSGATEGIPNGIIDGLDVEFLTNEKYAQNLENFTKSIGQNGIVYQDIIEEDKNLNNRRQIRLHRNDSDRDGLTDRFEDIFFGLNKEKRDTDNDGLNDFDEIVIYGTDPTRIDTDNDGIDDLTEIKNGQDPKLFNYYFWQNPGETDTCAIPWRGLNGKQLNKIQEGQETLAAWASFYKNTLLPEIQNNGENFALEKYGEEDFGYGKVSEIYKNSNIDHNNDGVTKLATDLTNLQIGGLFARDKDGDKIPNGDEIAYGLDPLQKISYIDKKSADNFIYNNKFEQPCGYDPDADADADGYSNYDEEQFGTNPKYTD